MRMPLPCTTLTAGARGNLGTGTSPKVPEGKLVVTLESAPLYRNRYISDTMERVVTTWCCNIMIHIVCRTTCSVHPFAQYTVWTCVPQHVIEKPNRAIICNKVVDPSKWLIDTPTLNNTGEMTDHGQLACTMLWPKATCLTSSAIKTSRNDLSWDGTHCLTKVLSRMTRADVPLSNYSLTHSTDITRHWRYIFTNTGFNQQSVSHAFAHSLAVAATIHWLFFVTSSCLSAYHLSLIRCCALLRTQTAFFRPLTSAKKMCFFILSCNFCFMYLLQYTSPAAPHSDCICCTGSSVV